MKRSVLTFLFAIFYSISFSQYNNGIKVEPVLKTDSTSLGQKIIFPSNDSNAVLISRITIPPGYSTGWHKHQFPVFAYVMEGTLAVEFENNTVRTFNQGTSFAEVVNVYHNGSNSSNSDLILIAFYLSHKNFPLSIKK